MEKITVRKSDVLEVVRQNRGEHEATYNKAVEVWRDKAVRSAQKMIDAVIAGEVIQIVVRSPVPEIHLGDYDRAIQMIEMAVGDEIVLSEGDFAQYVQDDWGWTRAFVTNTSSYVK